MTTTRYSMTVPAGTSLFFGDPDGSHLDHPVIGLLERTIQLDRDN